MTARHEPELWLVRHGETEWSRVRKHTGRTDLPLTADGEAAAKALAPRLAGVRFDVVLSSPLQRAWRTAELAGVRPEPEPDAMEWDYGDYEGRRTVDIREEFPGWRVWHDPIPHGESIDQVAERADRVVARIRERATERALLVAHGHFSRVLGMRWLGLDPRDGELFRMDTTTVTVLGWDRGLPIVERWNA